MSLIYVDPNSGGKLFQAGKNEIRKIISDNNISILILAADEYQQDELELYEGPDPFPGVVKFFVPLDDGDKLSSREIRSAKNVANLASISIRNGNNVLSTCWEGRNRSGLVSGFTLRKLTGCNGIRAIWQIKKNRRTPLGEALTNSYFRQLLVFDDNR